MANNKKPVALLKLEGKSNYSKEYLEKREQHEPESMLSNIQIPDYLPKMSHEKFEWLVGELDRIGIVDDVDADAIARYLILERQFTRIQSKIRQYDQKGNFEEEGNYHKMITTQGKILSDLRAHANDLGLNVTARGKITLPVAKEERKEKSEAEQLFGGALGGRN